MELKAKGIVGENNKGYLEFIGGKKEKADVVAAEAEAHAAQLGFKRVKSMASRNLAPF